MDAIPSADTPVSDSAPEDAEARYQAFVRTNLKRNYAGHLIHGMLGMTGFRLVNAPTFLPAYLHALSGSSLVVGLALGLQQLGAFVSPIAGAARLEHRTRLMPSGRPEMSLVAKLPSVQMSFGWMIPT